MEKFEGGELVAQFPPQGCGPSPPPEVAVAGGAAHVDVDDIGGGVEGGCPAHDVIHPQCLRLVRCLYGEHNLAYQEYPPKTAICPWDRKK